MGYVRITVETGDETRFEVEIAEKYSNMKLAVTRCADAAHEWIRQTFPEPEPDSEKEDMSYAYGSPVRNEGPPWYELVGCDECTADHMCDRHATHVRETKRTIDQWSGVPDVATGGWYVAEPGLPLVPQPGEPCRFCGCTVEGGSGLCYHESTPELADWRGMVLRLRRENAAMRARMLEAIA